MNPRTLKMLALSLLLLFGMAVVAQSGEYLDVYQVQVKPDKRADFDAIARKMADANRKNGGDTWITLDSLYGDANVVTFISTRQNYGQVEKGMSAFMGAMNKTFGPNTGKVLNDFNSCIASARGEIRRRRWDLSFNVPSDAAGRNKIVAESRFLRTTVVHVRPGRAMDFEKQLMWVKEESEKNNKDSYFVSQAVVGANGTVYYISALRPSFAAFDEMTPLQKVLGDEGYAKFQKINSEIIESATTVISRFVPEFSNAQTEVASLDPAFWTPKPMMAAGTKKPAKAAATKTEAKN